MNNLEFVPDAAKAAWDNIEIEKCKVVSEDGAVEPVYGNEVPDFWSVYLHQVDGGVQCVADLPTEEQAYALTELIRNAVKSYKDNGYLK